MCAPNSIYVVHMLWAPAVAATKQDGPSNLKYWSVCVCLCVFRLLSTGKPARREHSHIPTIRNIGPFAGTFQSNKHILHYIDWNILYLLCIVYSMFCNMAHNPVGSVVSSVSLLNLAKSSDRTYVKFALDVCGPESPCHDDIDSEKTTPIGRHGVRNYGNASKKCHVQWV